MAEQRHHASRRLPPLRRCPGCGVENRMYTEVCNRCWTERAGDRAALSKAVGERFGHKPAAAPPERGRSDGIPF